MSAASVVPPAAGAATPPAAVPRFDYTAGYLPAGFTWRGLRRTALRLAAVSFVIALLVNPGAWRSAERFALNYAVTFAYTLGLWLTNGFAVDWLNGRVAWTQRPGRRLLLTVLVSLVGSLVVIVGVNALVLLVFLRRPLPELLGARGNYIWPPLLITVLVSLTLHARSFLFGWRAAAVRAEQLEKESAVARLDSLRRQVDPHFLFNSLNALTSLVEENDPARAVRFIRQLSQVYRYVLDSQTRELVPLAEELAFARSYVFLQQTRLGQALAVEFDEQVTTGNEQTDNEKQPATQNPKPTNLFLPPLALQLVLENALKHNTAFQASPLRVQVTADPGAQTLTVRNTLRPRRLPAAEASGRGLANLRARYRFLTDRPVAAGPAADEFVVVLPLLAVGDE